MVEVFEYKVKFVFYFVGKGESLKIFEQESVKIRVDNGWKKGNLEMYRALRGDCKRIRER